MKDSRSFVKMFLQGKLTYTMHIIAMIVYCCIYKKAWTGRWIYMQGSLKVFMTTCLYIGKRYMHETAYFVWLLSFVVRDAQYFFSSRNIPDISFRCN